MRAAIVGGRGFHSNYGGVENAVREISRRLAHYSELSVDVYGQGDRRWFSRTEAADGPTLVGAPKFFSRFKGNALLAFVNCLYALLFRRPDVLLLFSSGPSLLAIFARILQVRVIAALRAIDSQRDKWGLLSSSILRMGEFSALHIADICTVNSLEMYRHYQGSSRGLLYIPNGANSVDVGEDEILKKYGLSHDGYLLFAARLDPVKRLHVLLQAYRQIPAHCRLPLVIAGDQCKSDAYRQQLQALAIDGVQFIGHVGRETLDPLMRHCAVFVLPSVLEGMSNSLLAAMQCGRCVVCADIDANRDVVLHKPEALFEADDETALAQKLEAYCSDPALRERCGHTMRQIVNWNFNWQTTAESYLDLIMRAKGRALAIADF